VAVLPAYLDAFAPFWERFTERLARLEVSLRIVGRSPQELLSAVADGGVDLLVARWIAAYPESDTLRAILHSRDGILGGFFRNPEIDRRLDEGRVETEPALRHAIYLELERLLEREALVVPLFHEQAYRFASPELRGLKLRIGWPEVAYDELYFEH
jgi:ABC-type oligopeptide transport system substrate-binding subunit